VAAEEVTKVFNDCQTQTKNVACPVPVSLSFSHSICLAFSLLIRQHLLLDRMQAKGKNCLKIKGKINVFRNRKLRTAFVSFDAYKLTFLRAMAKVFLVFFRLQTLCKWRC